MAKPQKKQDSTPEQDMAADLLLKEADEALRQDKLNALWDEWGSTIIGVALMIILGTMIGVGWQKWQTAQKIKGTNSLIQFEKAPTMVNDDLKGPYRGVADMITAARMASDENASSTEMTKLLESAAESGLPREWAVMAEWAALRTRADAAAEDEASTDEIRTIQIGVAEDMAQLARQKNNPYAPAILMEAAIIQGENGQTPQAITLLEEAKAHPYGVDIPALQSQVDSYLQLYKAEDVR